jgi:hypothetical protein
MKKYFIVLCIAAVHFVVTKMVTVITIFVFRASAVETGVSSLARLLMMISRVLYFPVMTMAWYPRRFFPGNFILIPLLINSFIWAIVIYMIFVIIKRWFPAMKEETERRAGRRGAEDGSSEGETVRR